ncbi:hypothetical protein FCL47_12235 [Desulfopila sp. IMCC35006]|uniref:hypothetical protein n=1 Tax=Desulfopila sp. IMCC35006 TaxID=2569542 RepID=UPI0010ACBDA9|nr:hypothetical protein [Desulfopila sp. IMCC35006]TKB25858.1 hypothetical protein FCL47_12235 [Desulfopila sp. IMCC35006]
MAEAPRMQLRFEGRCPDCGVREVHLPAALPNPGDDFDWRVRDYDDFRMFMLEELYARFPERTRWTPADLEVVLVEVLACVLDQLSDMLDRVAAESFLETARRPETVRGLLGFIGYDAVAVAKSKDQIDGGLSGDAAIRALENYWHSHPFAMAQAKLAGPRDIHTQKRMVTTEDYAVRLREHPLVASTHAWTEWSGSWLTLHLAVIAEGGRRLDPDEGTSPEAYDDDLKLRVINFHEQVGLSAPNLDTTPSPSVRMILRPYLDALRMVGQEVILQDPVFVGISMAISVKIGPNHFQSEIRHAIAQVLGHGPDGFFAPGRHSFGVDLYSSDIIEVLMALDGVENVCLNRFKRIGSQYPDRVEAGFIALDGLEVVLCDNDPGDPARGYYRLTLHGGRRG